MEGFSKKIEKVAKDFCERFEDELIKSKAGEEVDICDVCPFTEYCSNGYNGAEAFIKETLTEELKKYFE